MAEPDHLGVAGPAHANDGRPHHESFKSMNPTPESDHGWWPVATSAQLKPAQPLARTLLGVPLVLFRTAEGAPAALPDRCPHRSAPLSQGKVRDGEVECPYHGWRFDRGGRCTRVPGAQPACVSSPLLPAANVLEQGGLIWVSRAGPLPAVDPTGPQTGPNPLDVFFITDTLRCSLAEAAENFLDAFHTHFVHAGWIRNDHQRQKIRAKVEALPDGVQACYTEEGAQSGWISRLFEKERGWSFGRFRLPGLAEIEYRDKQGQISLLISAWLTPSLSGHIHIHARIASRRDWLPRFLKELILRRIFGVVLNQDKRILELTTANVERFQAAGVSAPPAKLLHSPLDLLGPHIRSLLAGDPLRELPDTEIEVLL